MSCRIGIENTDGSISSILCNQSEAVEEKLKNFYIDPDSVMNLINLGDIYFLGEKPISCSSLWTDKSFYRLAREKFTLAYKDQEKGERKIEVSKNFEDYKELLKKTRVEKGYLYNPETLRWKTA